MEDLRVSDPRAGEPWGQTWRRDVRPCRSIRVALFCAPTLLRDGLESVIERARDISLWQGDRDGRPDLLLWVAETGMDLSSAATCPERVSPGVLFDLAGRLGPVGAGIHGLRGYLPPEVDAERLLLCLRRVSTGEIDAPRPHLERLIRTLAAPPLDDLDRDTLRLLALGQSQAQITRALPLSERTLQRRITRLLDRFEAVDGHHLGAVAVALGLAWPWEGATAGV